jgi:hypothetical protein
MFDKLTSRAKAFVNDPYDDNMDLLSWALFIGLWVVIGYLWTQVIKRLVD